MKKRVVITGTGAITSIGKSTEEFINSIKNGDCGITEITHFDTGDYRTKLACEVKDFDPQVMVSPKGNKKIDRFIQFAVAAAKQAAESANIDRENMDMTRAGVIVGSGIGGLLTIEEEHTKLETRGPGKVSSFFIPKVISNMAAGNVSIALGTKGVCQCTVTACASSSDAIGLAFQLISSGRQDVIFAGGSEASITSLGIAGFEALKALSFSTDVSRASIPFDKDRNGFVMGEGAGVLVLEELEHALNRGANILGEVVGYGQTSDAYHITSPEITGDGARRSMLMAIEEAGIDVGDIDYINAHGTSTSYNDKIETLAIKRAFGEDIARKIPISSTKSMTGHLLGAAGAIEAIICLYALKDGFIPSTINYKNVDPECDLDYVIEGTRIRNIKYVLSNSLGFGGHNATLLLKKWEE